jgi:hypothetical protein
MEHDADPGWRRSGGRRALRLLLAGFFAPYVGWPVTAAYVGQLEDPSSTGWKVAALSACIVAVCVALCAVVPAVFLLQEITTWSFVHRHGYQREWRDIDWSDRRWHPVHSVIERLIPDPANVRFVKVFSAEGRIRTLHVPRSLGGRLGRLGDFGVRHQRKLMVAGGVSGLAIAAANDLAPGWSDSPAFAVVLVVVIVVAVKLHVRAVLDHRHAPWLTNLSACETGVPDLQALEQLVSFPTGFLLGGAAHVFATLWPVGNIAATTLNGHVYQLLADGTHPAHALRQAIQHLRHPPTPPATAVPPAGH